MTKAEKIEQFISKMATAKHRTKEKIQNLAITHEYIRNVEDDYEKIENIFNCNNVNTVHEHESRSGTRPDNRACES